MSWTNENKPNTVFSDGYGYLKKQDGFYLLLENGGKILLDQSFNNKPNNVWANDAK